MAKRTATTKRAKERPLTPKEFRRRAQPHLRIIEAGATSPEEKAAKLHAYHALGTLVRKHTTERSTYGDNQFAHLAEATGHNASWLYQLRRFSKGYSKRELQKLCQHADVLSWSHLVHLLRVPEQKRAVYLKRITRQEWRPVDLQRAIQKDFDNRHPGGRKIAIPDDPGVALEQLLAEANLWRRRCEGVMAKIQETTSTRSRQRLRRQAESAGEVLRQTVAAARKLAKELTVIAG